MIGFQAMVEAIGLRRKTEEMQLRIDQLEAENKTLKAEVSFLEQSQKTEEEMTRMLSEFEMSEDFRCQVEEENNELRQKIKYQEAQIKNLNNLLEEAWNDIEEAANDCDSLDDHLDDAIKERDEWEERYRLFCS